MIVDSIQSTMKIAVNKQLNTSHGISTSHLSMLDIQKPLNAQKEEHVIQVGESWEELALEATLKRTSEYLKMGNGLLR